MTIRCSSWRPLWQIDRNAAFSVPRDSVLDAPLAHGEAGLRLEGVAQGGVRVVSA